MAQKAPIDENLKTPPPTKIESLEPADLPKNHLKGVRPYIEEPEVVIKKAVRTSILLIILLTFVTAGVIFYIFQRITKMSGDLQSKQNLIYLAGQQKEMSTQIERQWKEISPNIPQIEAMLPASDDLLGYMGALENIAKTSGVQQTIKFQNQEATKTNLPGQENQATKKGSSVDYTIELKGNFDQILNYLNGLEKAPYFTKVTSINLASSQGAESQATIGAKVYTYPKD